MKTSKRRGFTIVELVIVIAVIAILAGVLIPTFTSIVKKANLSADEQAVRQMNTALQIYTAENGKPESAGEVKKALDENLINTESMIPVTQGYAFYWNPDKNEIVLVGPDKAKAQNSWAILTSTGYGKEPETPVTDKSTFQTAVNASSNADPVLVKLEENMTTAEEIVVIDGQSVIVDMNGKTIISTATATDKNAPVFRVKGGTLTIKNANIDAERAVTCETGSNVTLEHVNMECSGSTAVFAKGLLDLSISNCTIKSETYGIASNSELAENDGSRIHVSNTTIEAKIGIFIPIYADITIAGCTITGGDYGAFFRGCNATITNTTITHSNTSYNDQWIANGARGPIADIIFASGGSLASGFNGYIATGNYKCENVTVTLVIIHEPAGGKVTVSGIDLTSIHTCYKKSGETCDGGVTCTGH